MILSNKEMDQVRQVIEDQAHMDEELFQRCSDLIHMGSYDDAVRTAFVLLEERLRDALHEDGLTGTNLANKAFNSENGPLSKHLGKNKSERDGLRQLFAGAFLLFRNPTAHGVVDYDAADGKAIIGLVNLMLRIIRRSEELPPPDFFSENIETILSEIETNIGVGTASRLRMFLGKSVKLGLKPSHDARKWIPFRKHGFIKFDYWEKPRSHGMAVFYITGNSLENTIYFPTFSYYSKLVKFDTERLIDELQGIGFIKVGKNQELQANLRTKNDELFFEKLFDLVVRVINEIEDTFH